MSWSVQFWMVLASVVAAALTGAGCGSGRNASFSHATSSDCAEGTHRCVGSDWEACTGGEWTAAMQCQAICAAGRGCVRCLPGTRFCDSGTVAICKEDGSAGDAVTKCPGGACVAGACVDPCSAAGAELSYLGCHYWPTVTANPEAPSAAHFAVAVANPNDTPADVMVTQPGGFVRSAQVPAGGLHTLELPWVDTLKGATRSTIVEGGAYRLEATLPVTVYQFNPIEYEASPCGLVESCPTYSNDASLLLPQHTLTGHYIAVSRPALRFVDQVDGLYPSKSWRGGYSGFLSIVGTESGGTQVKVTFRVATRAGIGSVGKYAAGQTATFTLAQQDVLQLLGEVPDECIPSFTEKIQTTPLGTETMSYCNLPDTDLTGTEIVADQSVAVFSGHACDFVPFNRWACDHLEEQLLPLESWGKKYAVSKLQRQPEDIPDLVRIVSGADGNRVHFDPPEVHPDVTLNRGQWTEFAATTDFVAEGDAAFLVAQFMVGQDYYGRGSGDSHPGNPAMNLQVPVEQYRDSYIFLSPDTYVLNYVNVTATAREEVLLDGNPIGDQLRLIGAGGWSAGRIAIGAGVHRITSAQPFGIQVYGLAPYTSYMYPGGLDVKVINVQ